MDINGLVLESRYPEYHFLIKGPFQQVWRDGFSVQEQKIIDLAFDRYLLEMDVAAREQEWTAEERESVTRALQASFDDPTFRDMWVHQIPKPPLPWPTYDSTHHNQIAVIAQATGMVHAALAYEQRGREGGPRESVVTKLQQLAEETEDVGGESRDPEAEADEIFAA